MKTKNDKSKLTPKQDKFCYEYLTDLNATQAAIRAGYSKKTADVQAARLLVNVKVQKKIQELQQEARQRTEITRDEILQTLTSIIRADVPGYFKEKSFKNFDELTPEQAKAVESIKIRRNSFDFKLTSKLEAIKILTRMTGWEGVQDINLTLENLTDEALNKIISKLLNQSE